MSVFGKDEAAIGKFAASLPVPEFETTSFNTPNALSEARIAIVTTAALHQEGRAGAAQRDEHARPLPAFGRLLGRRQRSRPWERRVRA